MFITFRYENDTNYLVLKELVLKKTSGIRKLNTTDSNTSTVFRLWSHSFLATNLIVSKT